MPNHPLEPIPPDPPRAVRTIGRDLPEGDEALAAQPLSVRVARALLALSVLMLAVGMLWTVMIVGRMSEVVGTQQWPNTLGMVIECQEGITDPGDRDRPYNQLTYRYDVDDRRYTSSNVTLDGYQPFECSDYPLGKAVRVYYAPWRPALATLTPSGGNGSFPGQLAGAVLCLLVGIVLGVVQLVLLYRPHWLTNAE